MYQLVDIIDIMIGDYDHTPTWKSMDLSSKTVLEVGHRYEDNPVLVRVENGVVIDFQILAFNDEKMFVYLDEPLTEALRDELDKLLHTVTSVEKNSVYAVVKAPMATEDIRADMVSLSIPPSVLEGSEFQRIFKIQLANAKSTNTELVLFVEYTEDAMREMLPAGYAIQDYLYVLKLE